MFRLNDEEVIFNVYSSMKRTDDFKVVSGIESMDKVQPQVPIEERLGVKTRETVLMNFESDCIPNYDEMMNELRSQEYPRHQLKLELDLNNYETLCTRPSIKEPQVLELKALLALLRYVFVGTNNTYPMIVSADLDDKQVEAFVSVHKRFKQAIRWTISDIIGIPPSICTHKIQNIKDYMPSIEH